MSFSQRHKQVELAVPNLKGFSLGRGMFWFGMIWFGKGHITLHPEYNGPRSSGKYYPGWVGVLCRLCSMGCAGYVVSCAGYVVWVAQAMWWWENLEIMPT